MFRFMPAALLLSTIVYAQERVPVVVELFTSEGCSSCPPADDLLAELERKQPLAKVDVIVLSEHVDYWNSIGWKDPFSSKQFSARQQRYADLIHSTEVYTPQAVIDGHLAVVGSNRTNVLKAITTSAEKSKSDLQITVTRQGHMLLIDVPQATKGSVWVALTEARTVSHVANGENGGRTLQHVGVVRSLTKMPGNQGRITLDKNWGNELRVVAFVQDELSGKIVQAVQKKI